MRGWGALLLLLAACPKPPIPPKPVPDPSGFVACVPAAAPVAADACDGFFTADGFQCVRCPNVGQCHDAELQIYCVGGSCADDPACRVEPEDGPLQGPGENKP